MPKNGRARYHLFNSVFVIVNGIIVGSHRKINALRSGSEAWSSPGSKAVPVSVLPSVKVGILICGDAFSPDIAASLHTQGAQLLISSAAWAPGFHGPNGEWERCSSATGLPIIVCNRTGHDRSLDFRDAESVIVQDGRRLLSFSSSRSKGILIDWDLQKQSFIAGNYRILHL
jgi:predicted amidohydrolase